MMNATMINMQEESKLTRILKDERGMTLIELLAPVVILAIIAAIGVTAIGQVIQNTREDAGVSNVQQAMNAAKLYQSTDLTNGGSTGFNLEVLIKNGYLEVPSDTWNDTDKILFNVQKDGSLTMTIPNGALKAGTIDSLGFTNKTNEEILGLQRSDLWPAK